MRLRRVRSMAPSSATTWPTTFLVKPVDSVTMWGRRELPPQSGVQYAAFVDPSGGVSDAMTLAVAHLGDGAVCVLDAVLEIRPPFDPETAVTECAALLRRFGVPKVTGDRYAGEWPRARFREHGIEFEQAPVQRLIYITIYYRC